MHYFTEDIAKLRKKNVKHKLSSYHALVYFSTFVVSTTVTLKLKITLDASSSPRRNTDKKSHLFLN